MLQAQINKLRQQRAKAIADGRALHERSIKESRSLSTEENTQWEKFMKEASDLKDEATKLERQWELEKEVSGITAADLSANTDTQDRNGGTEVAKRQAAAFGKFLTRGLSNLDESERRDLSVGSGTDGGFLVAPAQWVAQLIKFVDDQTFIRAKATKMQLTSGESLGMPSLDTDLADCDWTSEIATGSPDTTIKFGRRELKPSPLAKRIKISNKLIQRGSLPVESLVLQRMGYKFAVTEEKSFLTGSGVGRPLGLFTADANGISTARDVSSGGTTVSAASAAASTAAADALINTKYALKSQYWARAEWLFHRDILSILAKLKDVNNNYLFRESIRVGEPDMLLGRPINMSEFAPNTNTTGLYVGLLGDFSFYHIVDALNMQVQRLTELYAETNQVGFIGRAEVDGMPILGEAFARIKNA